MSAPKSILGHPLVACTALELVGVVAAMEGGFVPPTANLCVPDPECDLDYVPNQARSEQIDVALVNACGFGGRNASLLVRRGASLRIAPRVH